MKAAFLDEAEPSAVSHAVRDVLERHGALVTEHVTSRVRFHSLSGGSGWSWTRAGYVGIYQPYGEKEVEVRLALRARWPHRILWTVASINVIVWLVTLLVNPPGTTWFVLAALTGLALVVAGIVHLNTWSGVARQEAQLMEEFEAELRKTGAGAAIERDEARRLRDAEAALAGEVERVRVERARKAEPKPAKTKTPKPARSGGPKLSFGRKKDPAAPPQADSEADDDDESPEAKRARLLALKAELERRREGDEPKP